MEILNLLHHRYSAKKFGEAVPNPTQLANILKAALRAPDHGHLQPYRFVVIHKEHIPTFSHYLMQVAEELNLGDLGLEKAQKLSQKAPLVIVSIAKLTPDIAKIPEWEQLVTAGCATYAMQLAANAQGFDTRWITGKWVEGVALRNGLKCQPNEKIIGFIMIGSKLDQPAPAFSAEAEKGNNENEIDALISYLS